MLLRSGVLRNQPVRKFSWKNIPEHIKYFINDTAELCEPEEIYMCTGGEKERERILHEFKTLPYVTELKKFPNSFAVNMTPEEAEDMGKCIFTCTSASRMAVPQSKVLGGTGFNRWQSILQTDAHLTMLFDKCMKGKKMYVVPFLAGPYGAPMSKFGIQITDSLHVCIALGITNKVGMKPLQAYSEDTKFIRAIHSNGQGDESVGNGVSPCDLDNRILVVKPETDEIFSFGSSFHEFGACAKYAFNLRMGSYVGKRDGWLASKMSVVGVQRDSEKMYFGLVGPRGTGKTTTAIMSWSYRGYKLSTVSDDSTWLWAEDELRAVNPSRGICTQLTGICEDTAPAIIEGMESNALYTLLGTTEKNSGLCNDTDAKLSDDDTSLLNPLRVGDVVDPLRPEARVMFPMTNLPNLDCHWESSEGVPISALVFFTRRSSDVPLIYEAPDAMTGLLLAAGLRNEKVHPRTGLKHLELDPFGMRHHIGCNIGHYMNHWLKMFTEKPKFQMPKIFFINNHIKGPEDEQLWPLGWSNFLLIDWIWKRMKQDDAVAVRTPIGFFPKKGAITLEYVDPMPEYQHLFPFSVQFWLQELKSLEDHFNTFMPYDVPQEYMSAIHKLKEGMKEIDASGRVEQ